MFVTSAPQRFIDRGSYIVDPGFSAKAQEERIEYLILHYTVSDDLQSLKTLTDGVVSSHYLVLAAPPRHDDKPVVMQLVPESKKARHAGVSNWHGKRNLNDVSVGIEIVNAGCGEESDGQRTWQPFDRAQIHAVTALAADIIRRHHIPPENVLGHSDIAPLRKEDPGPCFPWRELAARGIGGWPDLLAIEKYLDGRPRDALVTAEALQDTLLRFGYDAIPQTGALDEATLRTISAFQMHFRPRDFSGVADAETYAIAAALVEKYRG